jgi:hypothetical protein
VCDAVGVLHADPITTLLCQRDIFAEEAQKSDMSNICQHTLLRRELETATKRNETKENEKSRSTALSSRL